MIHMQDHRYPNPAPVSHTPAGAAPPRLMRLEGEECITCLTEAVLDSCEISMQVYPNTASDSVRVIGRMQEREKSQAHDIDHDTGAE